MTVWWAIASGTKRPARRFQAIFELGWLFARRCWRGRRDARRHAGHLAEYQRSDLRRLVSRWSERVEHVLNMTASESLVRHDYRVSNSDAARLPRCGGAGMASSKRADGRVVAIHLRPWPKLALLARDLAGRRYAITPVATPIAVCFTTTNRAAIRTSSRREVHRLDRWHVLRHRSGPRLDELDRIAELKRTDALLCDAANSRLSDRFLARFGWGRASR